MISSLYTIQIQNLERFRGIRSDFALQLANEAVPNRITNERIV